MWRDMHITSVCLSTFVCAQRWLVYAVLVNCGRWPRCQLQTTDGGSTEKRRAACLWDLLLWQRDITQSHLTRGKFWMTHTFGVDFIHVHVNMMLLNHSIMHATSANSGLGFVMRIEPVTANTPVSTFSRFCIAPMFDSVSFVFDSFPGQNSFKGQLIHSVKYKDANTNRLCGKRVAVVGVGNSAVDVAVDLVTRGCCKEVGCSSYWLKKTSGNFEMTTLIYMYTQCISEIPCITLERAVLWLFQRIVQFMLLFIFDINHRWFKSITIALFF